MAEVTVTADYGEGRTRTLSRVSLAQGVAFMRAALKYDPRARFAVTRHRAQIKGVIWL